MAISNLLKLEIQDRQTESTITVELTNETMHKLYRIKEIHKLNSLIEYESYARFCNGIKAKMNEFIKSIDKDYWNALEQVEKGNLKNDTSDAIKEMDKLITAGYDYKKALKIVSEKYFKE